MMLIWLLNNLWLNAFGIVIINMNYNDIQNWILKSFMDGMSVKSIANAQFMEVKEIERIIRLYMIRERNKETI